MCAARSNLGNVLCDLGEPAEALQHYELAIAAEPGSGDYHMNYANALRDLGRLPAAIARYDQALALRPGSMTRAGTRRSRCCSAAITTRAGRPTGRAG
ncbi:MAG: tetratricopeptide repeat protein [Pseudomonadota bacterium]